MLIKIFGSTVNRIMFDYRNIKRFLLFFSLFCTKFSAAQFPANIDSVYTFIKYNSIWRNTISDWDTVDQSFKKEISTAATLKDTMQCFVSVLEKLDDVHTQIYLDNKYYGYYHAADDSTIARLQPVITKARSESAKITSSLLKGGIVYIRVPGMNVYGNEEINRNAQALYDTVQKYKSVNPRGFIVDLRLNTGGNMYPMLAGLGSLLGEGVVGFETDIDNAIVRKWELSNGNFITGGYQATAIKQSGKAGFEKLPVAVLTGSVTASSGSMTAIAFKERSNTIFIGEPTADGYTTSNGYFQFAPNLTLNFATNFAADRKLTVYKHAVPVDITIARGDNFDELLKDKKIQAALKWFKEL